MNQYDLLHTNNFEEQYNNINNIIPLTETNETIRENKRLNEIKPIVYNNKFFKNNKIKNNNDLIETNKYTTDINNKINNDFNEIRYNNEKYKKIKVTDISIYSEDRNLEISPIPNNFEIELNKTYKNINKIVLKDIYFPNTIPILNEFNNRFTWEYPTLSDASNIFLPGIQPRISDNNDIYNGDIPWNNILTQTNKNVLLYSTKLNIINCDIKEFEKEFNRELLNNLYSEINLFDLKNCIDTDVNDRRNFDLKNNKNIFNQEIFGNKFTNYNMFLHRKFIFDLDINPKTNVVKLVNRIEKVPIYAFQIFNKLDSLSNDIFNNYSDIIPKNQITKDYIYILVKYDDFYYRDDNNNYFNDISNNQDLSNNIFPFVITNMNYNLGHIGNDSINYTPIYYSNLFKTTGTNSTNFGLLDGYSNNSISYYSYNDLITFTDICGNESKFVRLRISLSSGNKNGLHFDYYNGKKVYTSQNQTIITNSWLRNFINSQSSSLNTTSAIPYINQEEIDNLPYIGRALPIRLIKNTNLNDENNQEKINNEYIRNNKRNKIYSVLDLLGWNNNLNNNQSVSLKEKFYFVHSNIDSFNKNIYTKLNYLKNNPEHLFKYKTPQRKLNLNYIDGQYFFKSIPFIFVKIIPCSENIIIDNQLERTYTKSNYINNQEYKKEIWENSENKNKLFYNPNTDFILAKIYLEKTPFHTTIINDINKEFIFYNKPLELLQKIKIIITDPYGRIINIQNDYSLSIQIFEHIEVLKNTLFDTKRGNVVNNSYF